MILRRAALDLGLVVERTGGWSGAAGRRRERRPSAVDNDPAVVHDDDPRDDLGHKAHVVGRDEQGPLSGDGVFIGTIAEWLAAPGGSR